MVVDTLHPIIVKGIVDYNEDEEWTMDTLNDKNVLEALWQSGEAPWKTWR